jgi:DNA-binding CsgD family transcriptional regulator
VHALADHAEGAVAVAEGAPIRALPALRSARRRWRELAMPYDDARTAVQLAEACRALGDHEAAQRELDGALTTFRRLGASHDVEATVRRRAGPGAPSGPLTGREREVLHLVAAGHTNREIATRLIISQHTVARHLQNIFAKLDVSSRAAATAWAYEHHLI